MGSTAPSSRGRVYSGLLQSSASNPTRPSTDAGAPTLPSITCLTNGPMPGTVRQRRPGMSLRRSPWFSREPSMRSASAAPSPCRPGTGRQRHAGKGHVATRYVTAPSPPSYQAVLQGSAGSLLLQLPCWTGLPPQQLRHPLGKRGSLGIAPGLGLEVPDASLSERWASMGHAARPPLLQKSRRSPTR